MKYLIIVLILYTSTLQANIIDCKVKAKVGDTKPLNITSDKALIPVLKELGDYQIASLRTCDIGYTIKYPKSIYSLRVRFFLKNETIVVDNLDAELSYIHVLSRDFKRVDKYKDKEIEIYVRSESENKYTHLLSAITKGHQIRATYRHGDNMGQRRYILVSWRFINKDTESNSIQNPKRNIFFFTYKGLDFGLNEDHFLE